MPGQVQHNDLSETNNTASCSSITCIMIANVLGDAVKGFPFKIYFIQLFKNGKICRADRFRDRKFTRRKYFSF